MPYTPAQHRLFEWAAQNPEAARAEGYDIPQQEAAKMAHEGVKAPPRKRKLYAKVLRGGK